MTSSTLRSAVSYLALPIKAAVLIFTILQFMIGSSVFAQTKIDSVYLINYAKELKQENDDMLRKATVAGVPEKIRSGESIYRLVYIDASGKPVYEADHNSDAIATVSANEVHQGGSLNLNLSGSGLRAYVWEVSGLPRLSHQEFGGRVVAGESDGLSSHATHVAGTIANSGIDAEAKGFAFAANVTAYTSSNAESEMANAAANGAIVSNHSYGTICGWKDDQWRGDPSISTQEDYKFGRYASKASSWDNIAYANPFYTIVKSAGNDRNDTGDGSYPDDGPYDTVGPRGSAKNVITVGAVRDLNNGYTGNPSDVLMTSFSGWGPVDDGRIKPDLVSNGQSVYSSDSGNDTDYRRRSGTSMATPGITGSVVLLQELNQNVTGNLLRSATVKALLIHTADEAGTNDGPDYQFGWGLANIESAAKVILDHQSQEMIIEETLQQNATYTLSFTAGDEPIKVSLVWTDPAGANAPEVLDWPNPNLVNDLDVAITSNGNTYYPWTLDPLNPANAATRNVRNFRDNVEVLQIDNPVAGQTYTISVTHQGNLQNNAQAFSLIVDRGNSETCDQPHTLGANAITDTSATIFWEANSVSCTVDGFDVRLYEGATESQYSDIAWYDYNGTSLELSNLSPNTTYTFKVRHDCDCNGLGLSDYTNYTFTTLPEIDTCEEPHTLGANNFTNNSATIFWNANSENCMTEGFDVSLYQGTSTLGSSINSWNDYSGTSIDVAALTPNTTYTFKVRHDCDCDDLGVSNYVVHSFTTPNVSTTCDNPHTLGANMITGTSATIFWQANSVSCITDGFNVELYQGATVSGSSINSWTNYNATEIDLTTLLPNTTYTFRVRHDCNCNGLGVSNYEQYSFTTTNGTETCDAPHTLSATNITNTSALIAWEANAVSCTIDGFDVYLYEGATASGDSIMFWRDYNGTSIAVSDLMPNTTYSYRVRHDCDCNGLGLSDYVIYAFTTANNIETCDEPHSLSANAISATTATIVWQDDALGCLVDGFDIRLYEGATTSGSAVNSWDEYTENSINLQGLTPNTTYTFKVRHDCDCDDLGVSNFVDFSFTTEIAVYNTITWEGSVSSDWNNTLNWQPNIVPTDFSSVILPVTVIKPNLPAFVTINNIDIAAGASLEIGAGKTLNILNNVILNSTSTSYSSLLLEGALNVTGQTVYNRFVNSNALGNDLVAAPLAGQTWSSFLDPANATALLDNGASVYAFGPFNKTTGSYENYNTTSVAALTSGKGYRAATDSGETLAFTGTMPSATVAVDIVNSGPSFAEWNLVGNPYPSYLKVQDFFNHNVGVGVSNIDLLSNGVKAIYGYDGNAANGWTIYNLANTTPSTVIAPGQGFFVSADASTVAAYDLEFTNAMCSTGNSDDFILGRNAALTFVKLNLSSANASYTTEVYFNSNASLGMDEGYDAELWGQTVPSFAIYSHLIEDNAEAAIALQTLHDTDLTNVTIPLGVNANQGEQLSFSIADISLPASVNVYLDDVVANTSTLLNTSDYMITPNSDLLGTGRFYLRFAEASLSINTNQLDTITIYTTETKELVVSGLSNDTSSLVLYDLHGRKVLSRTMDNMSLEYRFNVASLSSGVYIVEVINDDKKVKTQKIVIN